MSFDFLSGIITLGGGLLGYLIPFLFVLTLVVFFHELAHFLVARRCGIRFLVFSIGFGPELFGLNDRHGTRWKLSAIPLGGYVKFFGDENAASVPDAAALAAMTDEERRHSFVHQSVARRAAVVVAGPVANFLLAIVIFAALFMVFGKPGTSPRVDAVQPGSAAEAAGFQPSDLVLTIDGRPVDSFPDMQQIVSTNAGETPLLDGGHLLYYAIEAVRGKPLSDRAQEVGFRIGLAIVVMLMIFATYNDLLHLAAQWTAS